MRTLPIPIYCHSCDKHLYNLRVEPQQGDRILASDFVPVSEDIPQPMSGQLMTCPLCNRPFIFISPYTSKIHMRTGNLDYIPDLTESDISYMKFVQSLFEEMYPLP